MAKETKNVAKKAAKTVKKQAIKTPSDTKTIVIAVLTTALICILLTILILFLTGTLKLNNNDSATPGNGTSSNVEQTTPNNTTNEPQNNSGSTAGATPNGVTCYDKTRAQVERLEFCLPDDFVEGGKTNDGAYTYNLVDDDGWADVKIYVTKSYQSPTQYIGHLSPSLKVVNSNFNVNGTNWVRAEVGDYMLAFATKSGDYIYAVLYTIKLNSDDTFEAWRMIPQTLTLSN